MEKAILTPGSRHLTAARDKAFPVSWDQFHRDARALAWRLASAGPFDAIVAITRGGLVPAAIVARELEVRVIDLGTTWSRLEDSAPSDSASAALRMTKALSHGDRLEMSHPHRTRCRLTVDALKRHDICQ